MTGSGNGTELGATEVELDSSADYVQNIQVIQARIIHVLSIYPKLSYSMLQVGIGPALFPDLWKPMLQGLIQRNLVKETVVTRETPTKRTQKYTVLELTELGKKLMDDSNVVSMSALASLTTAASNELGDSDQDNVASDNADKARNAEQGNIAPVELARAATST